MSEIYCNTSQFVFLDVYGDAADALPTATLTKPDGTTADLTVTQDVAPDGVDDRYHVVLTMAHTQSEGHLEVNWQFTLDSEPVTKTDHLDVITPYISISEIKDIVDDATDEDAVNIERAVRLIIDSHCGQTFGRFDGIISVTGSGEPFLRLPRRLMSFSDVNGDAYYLQVLTVRGAGWYLKMKNHGIPSIRADFDGWHENPYTTGVPIWAPHRRNPYGFIEDAEYKVNGKWGWDSVPVAVKEAAKLLVNDYACGDSIYRDRFISAVSMLDWKIQFNDGAFTNTGNVRANQLLSDYVVRRGWLVV